MNKNIIVNAYLRRIKKRLRCSKKLKMKFLDGLKREIGETPGWMEMDQDDLEEAFGRPETIALEFLEDLSEEERVDYDRCHKKRILIFASILLCIAIATGIYLLDLDGVKSGAIPRSGSFTWNQPNGSKAIRVSVKNDGKDNLTITIVYPDTTAIPIRLAPGAEQVILTDNQAPAGKYELNFCSDDGQSAGKYEVRWSNESL